jgi:hypothetical protein
MLGTFSSDLIREEVECSEYLCEIRKIKMREMKGVLLLLYSVLMLHSDSGHLDIRFDSRRGRVY